MATYTGYWLVYVNAASEDGPPQITVIPVDLVDRSRLIRDAKVVLKTADVYQAEHPAHRVVFFGEITRWLVKEKKMTWGELHVDFEVALAHLDQHAPNLILDTNPLTAATIATAADRLLMVMPGGASSVPVGADPIKHMILDIVDEEVDSSRTSTRSGSTRWTTWVPAASAGFQDRRNHPRRVRTHVRD